MRFEIADGQEQILEVVYFRDVVKMD
jgi:hypothetical protein